MFAFFRRLRFEEIAQSNLERALIALTILVVLYLVFLFISALLSNGKAAFQEHLNSENFYGNAAAIGN